ncbi:AzlC family ABC transporter permease [Aneurinibacillus aneurinilyticus]|jgi:4-azaleucine resistance transporter AzlC|uniref:AzlC family ABC transporter permease n=1 Tax=Aneurinibacillus aneurinilyticus TaxID=1391 RepID=A0A848CZH8_ANEAE|nr:AzlC family ABC transporter permease [Aneurinibacillus aneurinilyticus]MCI1695405.1 AzlC family ABC transporter permease [Aneurinibacillus aneurinilyticus]NME99217.1 AzlC family ABC transporter permease [Aneurinibacillus aneurinilyticus]
MKQEHVSAEAYVGIQQEDSFLQGVKDCLPTVFGYLSIGFAAGVIERTAGLSIMEIVLMSLFLYAGSAQFIAAGMLVAGAPISAIILTIFFANLRYLLLSAALAPYFRHLPTWKNAIIGFQLTDETFGVAANHLANRKLANDRWMFGLNITAYVNWLIANVAGGIFGQWIAKPEDYGLDFALPAMFIGLLVLQILGRAKVRIDLLVAISAIAITVGVSFLFSGGIDIIVATVLAATIGVIIEKWL